MRHIYLLLCAVIASTAIAAVPEYPTVGIVHHTTESSAIEYRCNKVGALLECEMTQNFVRKNLKDVDIAERSSKLLADLLVKPLAKDLCAYVRKEGLTFKERLADPSKIPPEYIEDFARISPAERENTLDYLRLSEEACASNSVASKIALRDHLLANEAGACRVGSHHWNETFKYHGSGSASAWQAVSEPQGECGVVQLNRFEKKGKSSFEWNYVARKAITNKDGETLMGGKCGTTFDEGTYIYSWKSRNLYLNCKTVRFSPL